MSAFQSLSYLLQSCFSSCLCPLLCSSRAKYSMVLMTNDLFLSQNVRTTWKQKLAGTLSKYMARKTLMSASGNT